MSQLHVTKLICIFFKHFELQNLTRIRNNESAQKKFSDGVDVVDYSQNIETGEAETVEVEISCVRRDMTSPLQKPESFGKAPSPMLECNKESKCLDDWFTNQNRY